MNKKFKNVFAVVIGFALMAIMFFASYYLFYMQTFKFDSDLQSHIRDSLNDNYYSFAGFVMSMFQNVNIEYDILVALLLSVVVVLTVLSISAFISYFVNDDESKQILPNIISYIPIACLFTMLSSPYFVNGVPIRVIITQPWHNSTYLFMRLFGIMAILFYFKICNYISKCLKVRILDCILFLIFFMLANWSKPNFTIAFLPAFIIYVISFSCGSRSINRSLVTILIISLLFTAIISVLQYKILFTPTIEHNNDIDNVNKIIFSAYALVSLSKQLNTFWYFVSQFIFPGVVIIVLLFNKRCGNNIFQALLMTLISLLQQFFILESGNRRGHGNFGWGSPFFSLVLYIICFVELIKLFKKNHVSIYLFAFSMTILSAGFSCGLYYYVNLLLGNHY